MTDFSPVAALFATDAYKLDHIRQYRLAGDMTRMYSNWTNRKSRIAGISRVVHFGLQACLQQHLMEAWEPFFAAGNGQVADLYRNRVAQVLGDDAANLIGADHIAELHSVGYLPLRFCAMPEGTAVPIRVPSFTVENTDQRFAWLVNYVEPTLSASIWQPSTSATLAKAFQQLLEDEADATGANMSDVDYQGHDFAFRGMSSHESGAASAAGHLLSFSGSDSMVVLDWLDRYYDGYTGPPLSVRATEHSGMSAGIASFTEHRLDRTDAEGRMFEALLDANPTGTIAVVSDTFNLWDVLTKILPRLKDKILARDGKLLIRPDSGDPEEILMGTDWPHENNPASIGVVKLLAKTFGTVQNAKGYHVLDPHVGTVYGDGITYDRAAAITNHLARSMYVSTTTTLGLGSFTYQYNTRDTFGSAMKATWAEINGHGVDLFKNPITDDGTKRSATGRLAVNRHPQTNELSLLQQASLEQEQVSLLQPVWENGKFLQRQSFNDVREVLASQTV